MRFRGQICLFCPEPCGIIWRSTISCGRSSMAEFQLPKLAVRVRFPPPAPNFVVNETIKGGITIHMSTDQLLTLAIMEINKFLKPSVVDELGNLMVDYLTNIKALNKSHASLVSQRFGLSITFICETIVAEGWNNIKEEAKVELCDFASSIHSEIKDRVLKAQSEKSDDIIETINIHRGLLSLNNPFNRKLK